VRRVPDVRYATVEKVPGYYAWCDECPWSSQTFDHESTAKQAAEAHNRLEHEPQDALPREHS
jgi:hypothetical protein